MSMVAGYMSRRFGYASKSRSVLGFLGFIVFSALEPLRLKLDYHGRHLFLVGDNGRRVLDVGAGNGEFLKRAGSMGWFATGLDPDAAAVMACQKQGLDARFGSIEDVDDRDFPAAFDAITLRHSIEHVPSPQADLLQCLTKLRPGGMLWLAWPNPRGPGATVFGPAWRGLEMPRHLCIPSEAAMRHMLEDAGYVSIRTIRRGHHARSFARGSGLIASYRPGAANRIRRAIAGIVGHLADVAATFHARGGEELVMVAFAPEENVTRG
ncbi:2-polyprenyl-3-methyl-5-hydroxy-6-metoxy-1,4-benzoquinol methylase [Luteibacter sp. 1214]|uniref:class I SAM-dependent methyltransferase n=1 Tax=Luteibacter sp. 1214 TaxID=2817735 RepID=UPI0028667471|nr:class I SAM-dependent methyltransferase [Luteibacter sp. 1214]MDR6644524.1 2-polyprenyl-3-methyl-5-hydroxy-6-metoxy-1,4-benzoquinol methylase [Luteibacter sp. 1214]